MNLNSIDLIDRIKEHEGFSNIPYKDSTGNLTIGYGRNLDANGISKEEALMMLMADIDKAIANTQHRLGTTLKGLSEVRKGVLYEMCFNLGIYGLLRFKKMLKAIRDEDFELASIEMMDSKWAKQVGRRAVLLSNIMHTNSIHPH